MSATYCFALMFLTQVLRSNSMKRAALSIVAFALISGCTQNESGRVAPADNKAQPAPSVQAPVAAPKSASTGYFELSRDGKTYVFGDMATMKAVVEGETPANLDTKEGYSPKGNTVIFQTDSAGLEQRLMAEYNKTHPKP